MKTLSSSQIFGNFSIHDAEDPEDYYEHVLTKIDILHSQERFPTVKIIVEEEKCYPCSLYGIYTRKPSPKSYGLPEEPVFMTNLDETRNDTSYTLCPASYQCVGENYGDESGCCKECNSKQLCPQGSIGFSPDYFEQNLCPPGFLCDSKNMSKMIIPCPAGFMCQGNQIMSCEEARGIPIENGWGDIHAGSYCPERSFGFVSCPQGQYCNMTTNFSCPEGFFCPLKTETPSILLSGSKEGATEISPSFWIYIFIGSFLMLCLVFSFLKNQAKRHDGMIMMISQRLSSAMLSRRGEKTSNEPNFFNLSVQMSEYENHDEAEDSTELIFDQLDTNKIGKIYFDDLNKLHEFGDAKLKYIVRKMKHEAQVDRSNGKIMIDKKTFIEKFPSIHAASTNLDVDSDVAEEIFEAMTKGTDGATGIDSEDLYKGAFDEFLSSTEVTFIVKEFRKVVGTKRLNNLVIPKQIFVDHYPRIIVELFLSDTITKERGVDITFSDMTLSVRASGLSERKKVVNNVTGRIQEATMNALMGGSGAGKSSLLNALCGRAHYGRVTGSIKINGHEAQIKDHKHLVGFVPQDDIVFAELTVRENLLYAGRFRLPENTTEEEIEDLANETIFSLGLSKVQDSIVGDVKVRGLSGGEKKRVNIGLELMARPRILFLDEPTSGLDSSSSSLVMESLKKLVDEENMTIVSVIHQPRKFIFDLFDNVILLGAGGKMIYHGSPSDVLHYFTSAGYKLTPGENIADWMMDISTGHLKPAMFASLIKQRSSMVLMGNFRGSLIAQNLNSFTQDTESVRLKEDIEARNKLFRRWSYYFETLPEEVRKLQFSAPDPAYEIPPAFRKKNFFSQFIFQSQRNLKLSYRKRREKMFDFIVLIIATIILCLVNGTASFVYHAFLEGNPPTIPLSFIISKDLNDLPLDSMFFPYEAQALKYYGDGLRLGIIIAGLVSILSTKFLGDKRLEFFREASSGYNVNAYYLALNITSTLEISVVMIMIGMSANAIRNTPSNWYASTLNFVMVGWISSGWGLLFSVMMSPGNLVLFTTFFVTISGFLLSGAAPPVQYETIYSNSVVAVISGLFSPLRFFIETMVVSDFKCLEEQTGFTTQDGSSLPLENRSFHKLALGRLDTSIEQFTCDGWYWGILPALLVGVNIRFFGLIMLHTCNRSKQSLQPIRKRLRKPKFFGMMILALVCQSIVTAFTVFSFTLPR